MGIVLCDIHGHGAIVETCRHVAEQIDSGMRPTGQRFTVLTELFICDDCFETLGFERFRRFLNLPAEEFIDIDDASAAPLEEACTSIEGRRISARHASRRWNGGSRRPDQQAPKLRTAAG